MREAKITENVLIGNEKLLHMFSSKIRSQTLSHAYLLTGPEGSGKTSLVMRIIKEIFCESDGERPCGHCGGCKKVESLTHPDLQILSKEPQDTTIKVKAVRDFLKGIELAPNEAPFRIYVIDDAETLGKEAQNALLKTLEEPTGRAKFFLLATTDATLLSTVRSRCMSFPMETVPTEKLMSHLMKKYGCDEESARKAARLSEGYAGVAYNILEKKGTYELRETSFDILKALTLESKALGASLLFAKASGKDRLIEIYSDIQLAFRDIAARSYGISHPQYFASEEQRVEFARRISFSKALDLYDFLEKEKNELYRNGNVQLSVLRFIQAV